MQTAPTVGQLSVVAELEGYGEDSGVERDSLTLSTSVAMEMGGSEL